MTSEETLHPHTSNKAIKRRRRVRLGLLLSALIAILIGVTYHSAQQSKLDRSLIDAVERNDVSAVRHLLRKGADPNAHLVYENTPHNPIEVLQSTTVA